MRRHKEPKTTALLITAEDSLGMDTIEKIKKWTEVHYPNFVRQKVIQVRTIEKVKLP